MYMKHELSSGVIFQWVIHCDISDDVGFVDCERWDRIEERQLRLFFLNLFAIMSSHHCSFLTRPGLLQLTAGVPFTLYGLPIHLQRQASDNPTVVESVATLWVLQSLRLYSHCLQTWAEASMGNLVAGGWYKPDGCSTLCTCSLE